MTVRWMLRLLVVACAVLGHEARAQEDAPTAPGPGAYRRLTGACRAETARLCPALANAAPSARNQLICLRPYKSSLSLGCRSAVTALTRP